MNVGKILGVSQTKHIILRATDWSAETKPPNFGDPVYDAEKRSVGDIFDIFGPVSKPFISVRLTNPTEEVMADWTNRKGAMLYSLPRFQRQSSIKSRSKKTYSTFRHSSGQKPKSRRIPRSDKSSSH